MISFRSVLALSACALLAACGGDNAREAGFAAALPAPPPAPVAHSVNGAIFQPATGYAPLHYGQRAARVGDIVSIVLVERISTSKSTSAKTSRSGSFDITPPSLGPFSFDPGNLNSGSSSSFKGGGDAAQTSSLNGEISVTIAEVRANGTALVRGEKLMRLSQGEEWVQLTGLVRLADISPDNRVASTRLADARISYGGKGAVQRASREGWLSKFFNLVSPF